MFTQIWAAPRHRSSAQLVHFSPALGTVIFSPFYRLPPSPGMEEASQAQLRTHALGQGFLIVLRLLPSWDEDLREGSLWVSVQS